MKKQPRVIKILKGWTNEIMKKLYIRKVIQQNDELVQK